MLTIAELGETVATTRKKLGLTQRTLAERANVARSTVDALENARLGELGFTRIGNILSVLGLELRLHEQSRRRPTLDELLAEDEDDKSLDRRG